MKKVYVVLILIVIVLFTNGSVMAKSNQKCDGCTKIKSSELYAPDGNLVGLGFDQWGFNFQARKYEGTYCNYFPNTRPGGSGHAYCLNYLAHIQLSVKWNDAYLSNEDCDGDGQLDQHLGFESYIGSGAWYVYTRSYEYIHEGEICQWENFVKAVAVPEGSYLVNNPDPMISDMWYTADGEEIGPINPVPGEGFASIQIIYSDPCGCQTFHPDYISPVNPGLGGW